MKKTSYIFVLLAGGLWGTTGFFLRNLMAMGFSQMQVVLVRMIIAALILGLYLLIKDPKLFRIRWKDLWCFFCLGIVGMLAFNYMYFTTMTYTTVAVAVTLLYTSPGFVVIFSAFLFKEKITLPKLAALIIIFMGCVCSAGIFSGSQKLTAAGLLFGLCSGLTYGLYSVFTRMNMNRGYSSAVISFYGMLICALGTLPFAHAPQMISIMASNSSALWFGIGIAIFCCLLPYIFYTSGMRHIETGEAAMLVSSEPVVASLLSIFLLGENVTVGTVLGVVLIILGIVVMNFKRKSK